MQLIAGLLACTVLAVLWLTRLLPDWLALICAVSSSASLLLYGIDKAAAQTGAWRIPELYFHVVSLPGGWPGALIGQGLFHHKTRKLRFMLVFGLCVIVSATLLGGVVWLHMPAQPA